MVATINFLSNPDGISSEVRRGLLDDLQVLNEAKDAEVVRPSSASRAAGDSFFFKVVVLGSSLQTLAEPLRYSSHAGMCETQDNC